MSCNVSILTPTMNQGRFLQRNIESVRAQGGVDVEHVIVDGASTDHTPALLARQEKHPADTSARLRWVSEPDHGQADALAKALAMSSGSIIGWLNADEYYEPGILEQVARTFDENPDVAMVYGHVRRVDPAGHEIRINRQWRFDYDICQVQTPIIINCGAFFRRDRLEACGGFDPSWQYIMDWELYIRFMRDGQKWKRLNRVLSNFTMHEQSKTATSQSGFEAEIKRLREREFPGWTEERIEAHKHRQRNRMVAHMLLDGVLLEKVWFKLVRQRQYAHLFGDPGARVPGLSRLLDLVLPASTQPKPVPRPEPYTSGKQLPAHGSA